MPRCDQCRFFTPSGNLALGECRHDQPRRSSQRRSRFPIVQCDGYCGGFQPRRVDSEFVDTFLADPSVVCDVDSLADAQAVNTESTPPATTWASWAAQASATWQHAENRNALHV